MNKLIIALRAIWSNRVTVPNICNRRNIWPTDLRCCIITLMFKRIVSQLSLSPAAAGQLTFYARRLKQERITRTFSALAAVLLIGLQSAVILGPPTPSNAASSNDIILGGIVSKDDLLNRYDSSSELQSLYGRMGITRTDIDATIKAKINSADHTLKSIGRNQHLANDFEFQVGAHTYWMRGLYTWDTGSNVYYGSSYDVLEGHRSKDGSYFAVMFLCGNIVSKTYPITPTPTPVPPTPIPTHLPTPTPTPKPTYSPRPTATPNTTPPPTPMAPTVICTYLIGSPANGPKPLKVHFTGAGIATNQTIVSYIFDFGDATPVFMSSSPEIVHTYVTSGDFNASLKIKGSAGTTSSDIPACAITIHSTTLPAAFTKAKSAANLTQNIDATSKLAQGGDLIKYHLTTKNTGGVGAGYAVVEHIEDVLEYADVSDAGGAILNDGVLTWPSKSVAAGEVLSTSFTVKIKNPVPSTPVGSSDKNSFDLRLDNIYGNAVVIMVAPPVPKQIEAAARTLPATGAPFATLIVLTISSISLFFYFRNRQLLAEVKLLRGEYQGGPR